MGVDWIENKQTTFVVNKQSTFTYAPVHHHIWIFLVLLFWPRRASFKSVICPTSNRVFQTISQNFLQQKNIANP